MKRVLVAAKLLAVILVACAAPIPSPSQSTRPETTVAAVAPSRLPLPTSTPLKRDPVATPSSAESDAPLGSSVLLAVWNDRSRQHEARPVDPRLGQPLSAYAPIRLGRNYQYVFSPDEKTLAVVAYPSDMHQRDGVLHFVDLQTWRDVTTTLKFDGWISAMDFSPDGAYLAAAYFDERTPAGADGGALLMIDVARRSSVAEAAPGFLPRVLSFTPDGKSLMAYGTSLDSRSGLSPAVRIALIGAACLGVTWEQPLPHVLDGQYRQAEGDAPNAWIWHTPAVVLWPDRQELYIVHADEDRLTTVSFARRTVASTRIEPARTWLERLMALGAGAAHAKMLDGTRKQAVLSGDGTRLYVVGQTGQSTQDANKDWQFSQTPLDLQVVDATNGVEIARLETQATEISLSPDGAQVFLRGLEKIGAPWTEVVDTTRLEVVARLSGRYLIPARQMNGQPILLSSDSHTGYTTLASLDVQLLGEIRIWSGSGYAVWLSPLWNPSGW